MINIIAAAHGYRPQYMLVRAVIVRRVDGACGNTPAMHAAMRQAHLTYLASLMNCLQHYRVMSCASYDSDMAVCVYALAPGRCSYVELLEADDVGPPAFYIIHAWDRPLLKMIKVTASILSSNLVHSMSVDLGHEPYVTASFLAVLLCTAHRSLLTPLWQIGS